MNLSLILRRTLATYPRIMSSQRSKAVLCHLENDDKFTFSFHLKCTNPVNANREFNMCRKVDEPMVSFTQRLTDNITKKLEKKSKKAKIEASENIFENAIAFKLNEENVLPDASQLNAKDFLSQNGLTLHIFSTEFDIDVNPPLVNNAKLPETIMSGFPVYPIKLSLTFAQDQETLFKWLVSDVLKDASGLSKTSWTEKHQGFFYTVENSDIDRFIKLVITPKNGSRNGLDFEVISKNPITAGPGKCPFEDRHAFTRDKTKDGHFRVVTYNLLADLYADSDFSRTVLHPQCPPFALEIGYRKSLFMKELLGYNADLMCLQEVDNKVFDHDLEPVFQANGFSGVFDRKGGQVSEGLACFWNNDKFEKLDARRLVLGQVVQEDPKFNEILEKLNTNQQLKDSFVNRTTALQSVILRDKTTHGQGLIVATTHLYFSPDADHIRLLQIAVIMKQLEHTKAEVEQVYGGNFSVLLCGDFNSTPPFGVLQFMREKVIDENHSDWSNVEGEHVVGLKIQHELNMESACGTPKYTNYTIGFKDCLDYIFYQCDKIEVTSVVPFPSEDEMSPYQGLPNVVFPSDHIACIAELKWK